MLHALLGAVPTRTVFCSRGKSRWIFFLLSWEEIGIFSLVLLFFSFNFFFLWVFNVQCSPNEGKYPVNKKTYLRKKREKKYLSFISTFFSPSLRTDSTWTHYYVCAYKRIMMLLLTSLCITLKWLQTRTFFPCLGEEKYEWRSIFIHVFTFQQNLVCSLSELHLLASFLFFFGSSRWSFLMIMTT